MSLAYLFVAVYALRNVARVLALRPRDILNEFWRPALAAAIMAGALGVFAAVVSQVDRGPTLVRLAWLAVEILLGMIVYGAALVVLARSTVVELIQALRGLFRRTHLETRPAAAGLARVEAGEQPR